MDAAQKKVEDAVNKMLTEVDQASLRKIQGSAFRCCATCCDDMGYSMEDRQNCIGKCMDPVANAQEVLASELNNFQNRIERCVMECGDKLKDQSQGDPKKARQFEPAYELCVSSCADTHIKNLPNITKTVLNKLKQ